MQLDSVTCVWIGMHPECVVSCLVMRMHTMRLPVHRNRTWLPEWSASSSRCLLSLSAAEGCCHEPCARASSCPVP